MSNKSGLSLGEKRGKMLQISNDSQDSFLGTGVVYDTLLRPYVSKHEIDIDRSLIEFRDRAWNLAIYYWHNCTELGSTKILQFLPFIPSQSGKSERSTELGFEKCLKSKTRWNSSGIAAQIFWNIQAEQTRQAAAISAELKKLPSEMTFGFKEYGWILHGLNIVKHGDQSEMRYDKHLLKDLMEEMEKVWPNVGRKKNVPASNELLGIRTDTEYSLKNLRKIIGKNFYAPAVQAKEESGTYFIEELHYYVLNGEITNNEASITPNYSNVLRNRNHKTVMVVLPGKSLPKKKRNKKKKKKEERENGRGKQRGKKAAPSTGESSEKGPSTGLPKRGGGRGKPGGGKFVQMHQKIGR
ncbi:hypothetical protein OROGR_011801 [Orobanche gracilis]